MNATEATSTEEDNRQRGKGNAGRCSKQARESTQKAVVHPKSTQNLLYLSEKWKQFGNIVLVVYEGIDYLIVLC